MHPDIALRDALPELREKEKRMREWAASIGIAYDIANFGGIRTEADTTRILRYRETDYAAAVKRNPNVARIPITNWRPIAPFGRSKHNWGGAFDVRILAVPRGWTPDDALKRMAVEAPRFGLKAGRYFRDAKGNPKSDPPHFELPASVQELRLRYLQGKGALDAAGRVVAPGELRARRGRKIVTVLAVAGLAWWLLPRMLDSEGFRVWDG